MLDFYLLLVFMFLVMTVCAVAAYFLTVFLAKLKRLNTSDTQSVSSPQLGWEKWFIACCLGSFITWLWIKSAGMILNPFRGEITSVGYTAAHEHDTFVTLTTAGLMVLLALLAQLLPHLKRQYSLIYGTRRVVAVLGWMLAFWLIFVTVFSK
ncbi:hypothetical protein Pan153_33080 [Gimesia panareensis]|uniref:Uncharacterized protein n=2 Tax=Gimesia panareensis TaxID=2527978 RepID=A0A518FQN7_9PLAN|nr:hypothetical protein Pan153_33080 [Gimesia panareensis]